MRLVKAGGIKGTTSAGLVAMTDINTIADHIQELTLIEASKLIKLLEEKLLGFASAQAGATPTATRAISLDTRPDIAHVKAILNVGREITLSQKPLGNTGQASQCTFFGDLTDRSFAITLRLDWSNRATDANGDPMLDADIYHNGKKYRVHREKWHHTRKAFESGEWVYDFEFENIKLRFRVGITSQQNQQGKALIAPPPAPSAAGVFTADLHAPWAFGERQVFCAACQVVTAQSFVVDHNNEIAVSCRCGRHLKFPLTETKEQFDALLAAHHKANQGQVRV